MENLGEDSRGVIRHLERVIRFLGLVFVRKEPCCSLDFAEKVFVTAHNGGVREEEIHGRIAKIAREQKLGCDEANWYEASIKYAHQVMDKFLREGQNPDY